MPNDSKMFVSSIRGRWLADRMRQLREQAGLTIHEVGAYLDRDYTALAGYESGKWPLRREDVVAMLNLYGVYDDRLRDELTQLADESGRMNWWRLENSPSPSSVDSAVLQPVGHGLIPPPPAQWLYSQASELSIYAPATMPDLLQTGDYALAFAAHITAPETAAERGHLSHRVDTLLRRRELILANRLRPITVVIDEHVLRRPIGGVDVLTDQIDYLQRFTAAEDTNIAVRILPSDVDVCAGTGGAFTIMHFRGVLPPAVLVDHLGGQMLLEGPTAAPYVTAFDQVSNAALPPAIGNGLLADLDKALHTSDHPGPSRRTGVTGTSR